MAKTIPTTHELVALAEVKSGQPIAVGKRDEVAEINRQTSRVFSASPPTNRVVFSSEAAQTLTTLPGSFNTIARGKIRVWGDGARFQINIEAQNVRVEATIGGVLLASATAGAFGFYSGAITQITGATIVDGFAIVVITAREWVKNSVLNHVVIEELPVLLADMPTPADPALDLDYWQLDDEMYQALEPLDVWAIQALDDNIQAQRYLRAPGVLHCKNLFEEEHFLSSINWRCDGPYMIASPPWGDVATVIITAALETGTTEPVDIIVYSEHERFDDVQGRLQSITSTTAQHLRFDDIKLRPGSTGATPQMIWIAFRSHTEGVVKLFTSKIGHYSFQKPWRLHCENLFGGYINWPRGVAGFGQGDSSTLTFKQQFSYGEPTDFFDIATVEGLEAVVTSGADTSRQPILISPHSGTGHLQAPQFETVIDPAAGIVSQADFDVYEIGTARLEGVYIEATVSDTARRNLAWAQSPPSASLLAEIAGELNSVSRYLSPQLIMRHNGARNIVDATFGASTNTYKQGHYWFLPAIITPGPVFFPHQIEIPLGGDPNTGAVSGLLVDTVYAQIVYMVTSLVTAVINTDNVMGMYFTGETITGDLAPILPVGGGYNQPSPTLADATLAAVSGSQDPATSSPTHLYENDYSQQYTWPTDTFKPQSPWSLSPIVATTLPGSFPTKLVLNIENQGGRRGDANYFTTTTMIVAGLCVWCGPRRE